MRKFMLVAAVAALSACNQNKAEPTPAASETAAPAAAASANGSPAGAYASSAKGGPVTTTALNADGTYTDSDARGKVTAQGTWAVKDGKTCFTATTKGAESGCYAESAPGADGSFTATPDKGDPITVKPVVVAAADMAGTYDFMDNGKPRTSVLKADGTYQDTVDGKVVESGTWTVKNGETCFDDKKDPPFCFTTTKPDAKGMFTATSTDGKRSMAITKKPA